MVKHCGCVQEPFRVSRSGLFCAVTSVTSWSRSTSRACSSSSCPGCRSGSTSTPVQLECPSACWRCWRRRRSRQSSTHRCLVSRTSRRSTSGCPCVCCSSSSRSSSTPSSTCSLDVAVCAFFTRCRDHSSPACPTPCCSRRRPRPKTRRASATRYVRQATKMQNRNTWNLSDKAKFSYEAGQVKAARTIGNIIRFLVLCIRNGVFLILSQIPETHRW